MTHSPLAHGLLVSICYLSAACFRVWVVILTYRRVVHDAPYSLHTYSLHTYYSLTMFVCSSASTHYL